jgi:flagellar basal-body rod modification protein FlgD
MADSNVNGLASLNQDQFVQLLLAGLKNQDPMQPLDNQDFLAQLSQFANLQGIQSLNVNFGEMLKLQQLTNGASLIGKVVQYSTDAGDAVGRVLSLSVRDGKVHLNVGSREISLDQVKAVAAG